MWVDCRSLQACRTLLCSLPTCCLTSLVRFSDWLQAQMVGPLSAAGTMCERMHAVHRWCVTGAQCGQAM